MKEDNKKMKCDKRLVKEAWELLLIPTNQVASNLFKWKLCRYEFDVLYVA
jgi:hypothetical protein